MARGNFAASSAAASLPLCDRIEAITDLITVGTRSLLRAGEEAATRGRRAAHKSGGPRRLERLDHVLERVRVVAADDADFEMLETIRAAGSIHRRGRSTPRGPLPTAPPGIRFVRNPPRACQEWTSTPRAGLRADRDFNLPSMHLIRRQECTDAQRPRNAAPSEAHSSTSISAGFCMGRNLFPAVARQIRRVHCSSGSPVRELHEIHPQRCQFKQSVFRQV